MISIRLVIDKLKSIAGGRPDPAPNLLPFKYTTEIDDSDEQDLDPVATFYPSKPDLPRDPGSRAHEIANWQARCQVLISGINVPVGMTYVDAKGDETKREVGVQKLIRDGELRYIQGFCYLRQACRAFREDRAQEIIELETGEVHASPVSFFDKYGIFNTPRLEELQVMLHILIYLAKADRKFCDAEKGFISQFVSGYCKDPQKTSVLNYVDSHKVKKQDFVDEASKLAHMPEEMVRRILSTAETLTRIDNKVTPKERELFDLLKG
jgi:hypothetical protein